MILLYNIESFELESILNNIHELNKLKKEKLITNRRKKFLDMGEIKEGPWMQEPISEGQVNFIEMLIKQAIDDGLDEAESFKDPYGTTWSPVKVKRGW